MAYNTFRSKDMVAERELAKFLDKHLYTQNIFTKAERTDNAKSQIEGSDKARLIQLSEQMRASQQKMLAPTGKTYRFFFTLNLAEKPVNILLNKEEKIRLGEFHYFVKS